MPEAEETTVDCEPWHSFKRNLYFIAEKRGPMAFVRVCVCPNKVLLKKLKSGAGFDL